MPILKDLERLVESMNKGWIRFNWKSIQLKKEECCICFDETNHTTECKHILCIECNKKIKKCPICRREQRYKKDIKSGLLNRENDEYDY